MSAGYPAEFREYFAHCSSLGFEDRPDYRWDRYADRLIASFAYALQSFRRLLKRLFKDLFERQGFEDDGIFDWDILKKQKEQGSGFSSSVGAAGANEDEGEDADKRGGLETGMRKRYLRTYLLLLSL